MPNEAAAVAAPPTPTSAPMTPTYIPWRTFMNTLDGLAQNMPNRIDRSAFPGQPWVAQSQLLQGFRFFGLITEDGTPTPSLHAVAVSDDAARKKEMRKLVEQKYAPLIALNLMKTTPAQFAEKMTEVYNISGDTRLKATRFFLNAVEYVGIQISPLLLRDKTKTIGAPTTTRKRRVNRPRAVDDPNEQDDQDDAPPAAPAAAESRSVELRSGGTLTLSATTKFMSLSSDDRKFVFGLIDEFEEYEKGNDGGLFKS
jgi:hypothetical protein